MKLIPRFVDFNEDWFISYVIPNYIIDFNIAPIEEAVKFSFEEKPWFNYEFEFWKPHIVESQNKINRN